MKSVLLILGLGIGLWSLPASARSYDLPAPTRAQPEVGEALQIHRIDPGWQFPATWPSAIRVRLDVRETQSPWASFQAEPLLQLGPPQILGVVAGVPEPSAMTLFGVGLLLTLLALPRRSTRGCADASR